jgi:hypothetical protein
LYVHCPTYGHLHWDLGADDLLLVLPGNIAKKTPASSVVLETKKLDSMPGGLTKDHAYAVIKAYTDGSTDK